MMEEEWVLRVTDENARTRCRIDIYIYIYLYIEYKGYKLAGRRGCGTDDGPIPWWERIYNVTLSRPKSKGQNEGLNENKIEGSK